MQNIFRFFVSYCRAGCARARLWFRLGFGFRGGGTRFERRIFGGRVNNCLLNVTDLIIFAEHLGGQS